ncbi:MAG: phosphodiester glycosidase family protein [Muribaculaceae bacterium]|nr:phosphodiester glycosidase family protein [Muribaculaceae bacterium]
MKNDNERIIDVDDDPVADSRPIEVPEISIEKDSGESSFGNGQRMLITEKKDKKFWVIVIVVACLLGLPVLFWYFHIRSSAGADSGRNVNADNISALSIPYSPASKGTFPKTDSLLGVIMDMYPLDGLYASLEREFPDTADRTLVMFMRSADYHPDGRSLGPLVVDGVGSDNKVTDSRDGYVAVSPSGRTVIGISSDNDVEIWARENNGDFFRQMVLLVDGELPRDFILRGKVERAAIASTVEGNLYYIVTRNKESMYDFADALREYGFVDAVYMTGGNAYSFYRDADGNSHVNSSTLDKIYKYGSRPLPQPLLVFRRTLLSI